MNIDLPTLMFVGGLLGAICGAVLLVIWWQHRETSAALWWAIGHIAMGCAVILFAVGYSDGWGWAPAVGVTFLIAAPAAIWSGVRSFWGKPTGQPYVLAGLVVYAGVAGPVEGGPYGWLPSIITTAIILCLNIACAWELGTGSVERLKARVPLVTLTLVNACVYMLSVPAAVSGQLVDGPPPLASLFGVIHFQTILFTVGTTIFFVALIKERGELQRREEAETDVLTQLPNRRAFLSAAERLAERRRRDSAPFAVAAFDLDHFKQINDRFGHAIGDRTLQAFAEVARQSLRPGDLVSRIGGEEFAAIFPGADLNTGLIMAERIRRAFAEAGLVVDGRAVGATVSGGVAFAQVDESLAMLMERADAALYKAKLNGRDRVELDGKRPAYPRLVDVA